MPPSLRSFKRVFSATIFPHGRPRSSSPSSSSKFDVQAYPNSGEPLYSLSIPIELVRHHRPPIAYLTPAFSYDSPPQFDVTLEQFESFALDRLRLLTSIESSYIRNKSFEELKATVRDLSRKHMPLNSNTAKGVDLDEERKKDHVSHFVLRLAFCRTEELRRRFCKSEVSLFRVRWETDDIWERDEWIKSRDFGWEEVGAYRLSVYDGLMSSGFRF